MTEDRLVLLIARRMAGTLIPGEVLELEEWMHHKPADRQLLNHFADDDALEEELWQWKTIDPVAGYAKWMRRRKLRRVRALLIGGCAITAVVLIAIMAGGFINKLHKVRSGTSMVIAIPEVPPGRNTATLILSNGRRILLEDAGVGDLALQGHTRLVKSSPGRLSYLAARNVATTSASYNVLETPRAGQYELTLSDGSHVWLNNVSSLRYPTAFTGKTRTVELTGEGYFEIVRDPGKPFIVKVRDESVEVLGTSFNIMAYPEEGGTQTTLLTGAVRIRAGKSNVLLARNQQSKVDANGGLEVLDSVSSKDIVSWKNGFFYFGNASFEAVMRQLGRWYDVEVVYEGQVPDIKFGGKIDRSLPLGDVLKFLGKNQIHFRQEGRKLVVLPK